LRGAVKEIVPQRRRRKLRQTFHRRQATQSAATHPIINNILNLSRIDAGQTIYDLTMVPVQEVPESVGQMILPLADAKGLTFEMTGCPSDGVACADRAKVEQIADRIPTRLCDQSVKASARFT
jgi:signal transduction histidine kinase